MPKSRLFALSMILLALFGVSAWLIYQDVRTGQESFMTGQPPEKIEDILLPQTMDVTRMRPPAIRPIDPVRYGDQLSTAAVIVYGDYQCEECRVLETTLNKVLPSYGSKVRLVWRDFPQTDKHPKAMDAAIFTRCAGLQGKFWETQDEMFKLQALTENELDRIIAKLKLDEDKMFVCRRDDGIRQAIEQDVKTSRNDGVDRIPFMFVGTKAMPQAPTETELNEAIRLFLAS